MAGQLQVRQMLGLMWLSVTQMTATRHSSMLLTFHPIRMLSWHGCQHLIQCIFDAVVPQKHPNALIWVPTTTLVLLRLMSTAPLVLLSH